MQLVNENPKSFANTETFLVISRQATAPIP
jgi:hypothetical protein